MEKVPKMLDQACVPPPGYLTISESISPSLELINISRRCGVSLAQFLHRDMLVTMGLITFFIDREAILTPKYLSQMGRLIIDIWGRIIF
ncbi:hypothetical protein IEQ34_004815 [Dendrobium chrysotoxum]|uniref:Uncharacterized protein n=1 Tax=Dendrobium chrysotoxum TaxID=161865 RepID=A0AAV7H6V9_DENCH|nr:hypothetical protein IEQ34_004815 [Dendrobium chrysotoxum]